jgi:hypothetical protein
MELNKKHRETLLNILHVAIKELETHKNCQKLYDNELDMLQYLDIEIYLSQQKIGSIEHALIENNIDRTNYNY